MNNSPNMSHSFLDASIPDVVKKLKTDEKISLLAAPNWWNTNAIPRLGIPAVRMSDGPNGVRGSSHFVSTPAQCLPCATSLAATFDVDLIYGVGVLLAEEAKIKSSVILLAPTCNIQRSPLGGRAFESFSEDPTLSGEMASAYVKGMQANGVAATIKHFVANDQEHERTAADSVMSERALREIYLYPFMLAQKNAQPWAYMTSYGRIDGIHCCENPRLLKGILREEWGFNGIVMSDWYGTYSVDLGLNAGMELEMPGPPRWRTSLLVHQTLSCQKVLPETLDQRVANLLLFVQKLARKNPQVVYGDGEERSRDSPEARVFCRKLAANGMVLLKNQNDVLPLKSAKTKKVAIIGPSAKGRVISGGGSAALKATYVISPYEGLTKNAPKGIEINYALGCYAHKYLPTLESNLTAPDGQPGWLCTFYKHDEQGNPTGDGIADFILKDTRIKLNDFLPPGLTPSWTIKLKGTLKVDKTAPFEFGLTVAGRAKLWVDGKLTIDNWTKQTPGEFFYGQGTVEERATVDIVSGKSTEVLVEYTNTSPPDAPEKDDSQPALMRGVLLGGCEKIDPEKAIEDAVALAEKSDVVLFIGGLTPEWESEGFDRANLDLPGRQDEVISRLAKVNPNTVVCIQAGSAVAMPWVNEVNGIVQAWYSGNEVGNALSDILYGEVNPSGRLPLTLPARVEDIAAFPNLTSENGKIHYREDLYVGYKHYQARGIKPIFPFGHGLSYTTFEFSDLSISSITSHNASFAVEIVVSVKNTGPVAGSEVAQVYISYPHAGVLTPEFQLRGFSKIHELQPGKETKVTVKLDKYAISFWNTPKNTWTAAAGKYGVFIGKSSENRILEGSFELEKEFSWVGL